MNNHKINVMCKIISYFFLISASFYTLAFFFFEQHETTPLSSPLSFPIMLSLNGKMKKREAN